MKIHELHQKRHLIKAKSNSDTSLLDYLFENLDTPIVSDDDDYRTLAELFPEDQ